MAADVITVEISAQVRVDRATWESMTQDERAEEVQDSVADVNAWTWRELEKPPRASTS